MKAKLLAALRIAVSAGILAFVLSRVSVDALLARAAQGRPLLLTAALALALLAYALVALRWRLLAGWLGIRITPGEAIRTLFLAVFGGQVLPAGVGMDVLRGWLLARHGAPPSRVIASLMADRLVGLAAVCLLVPLGARAAIGAAAVAAVACVALVSSFALRRALPAVRFEARVLGRALALALAVHTGTVAMAALSARAYGIDASPALWLAVIPLTILASAIPVSLNGWGVREAAVVVLAAPHGVGAEEALLVAVTLGVLNMIASFPGALVMVRARRQRLV